METKATSRTRLIGLAGILAIAAAGYAWYARYSAHHPGTDDAYVNAPVARIAPEISGKVTAVHVDNLSQVREGTVLFEVDSTPYQYAVDAARAQFDSAVDTTDAAGAGARAAAAALRERQAALDNARSELTRLLGLSGSGAVSQSQLDAAYAAAAEAKAAYDAARAQLDQANATIGGTAGSANARIRLASATLQRAELDLLHTSVIAPADGWIVNLSLRPGTYVAAGTPVVAFVANEGWWIDANFKETDLARIEVGHPATIELDMYADRSFSGRVDAVSIGSGAAFSLFPPENATGNWVKVTQRFTVKIVPDHPVDELRQSWRLGASAAVTIDTTAAASTQ